MYISGNDFVAVKLNLSLDDEQYIILNFSSVDTIKTRQTYEQLEQHIENQKINKTISVISIAFFLYRYIR